MDKQSRYQSFGTQIKKSPYFMDTERHGCTEYSVYNHIYTPRCFGNPARNYENLTEKVVLIDAAPQRQVEITGPNAWEFVRLLTPRNLEKCAVGQCMYVLITAPEGGIISDPVLLRLGENHVWLSAADGDLLLWVKGVAINSDFNIEVCELDIAPLQIQGPNSLGVMESLLGSTIDELRWYWCIDTEIEGMPVVVSRTGWTSEIGYEIYLKDTHYARRLWQRIIEAGKPYGIEVGHTSTARRIEGGILALIADMDLTTTPLELGLDRIIDLNQKISFIGKAALKAQKEKGPQQKLVGLTLDGPKLEAPNDEYWRCEVSDYSIGHVTSCVYSPRVKQNIGFAIVDINHADIGSVFSVIGNGLTRKAVVVELPFYDPKKLIPRGLANWQQLKGTN